MVQKTKKKPQKLSSLNLNRCFLKKIITIVFKPYLLQ